MQYKYKGLLCNENPFDISLYMMLIHEIKPGTIVEIGTKAGGSALWLRDVCKTFGLQTKIYSMDIVQTFPYEESDIIFIKGDAKKIEYFLGDKIATMDRPLLVIEDADHQYATTSAVLNFFSPLMNRGEYIVVEDGVCESLDNNHKYDGGPNRAVAEFLEERNDFEVDYKYCDFFGHNVTWNPNGYLKKL